MRRFLFTLVLSIALSASIKAQDIPPTCGTESTERYLRTLKEQIFEEGEDPRRNVTHYPASIYIIRRSDGTGGMLSSEFNQAFSELNLRLAPSGVSLFVCGQINYIDSDQYFAFVKSDEHEMTADHYATNTVNIYFPNSVTTGGGTPLCGYAYYPGWQDVVIVDKDCAMDGSTFEHEIGHYFGLLHTHGISNASNTDELVNLTNCISAGDDVCDTPADPNLLNTVDSSCIYVGGEVDITGTPYDPDPTNVMSYAPKPCRTGFSTGQYQRMSYVASHLRDYLGCMELSADFEVVDPLAMCADWHTTPMHYTGVGATSFAWDVDGDGATDYTEPSIQHAFFGAGQYDICLTVSNENYTITKCQNGAVQIMDLMPQPYLEDFGGELRGTIVNPDHNYGWAHGELGPNYGGRTLMVDNYHYNSSVQEDYFLFGPIDMHSLEGPILSYDIAYAPYSSYREDGLRIDISTDCGQSYTEVDFSEGLALATSGGYVTDQWMPVSSEDWRNEQIDLSDYTTDTVIVRFVNITGFGNNLYIDNVSMIQNPELALEFLSFELFHHPKGYLLAWETGLENTVSGYDIEISADGLHFRNLDHVLVQNSIHNVYHYVHVAPPRMAFYRIRAHSTDGADDYSPIRQISSPDQGRTVLYPNPVRDVLHLQTEATVAQIHVYDASGSRVTVPDPIVAGENMLMFDVALLNPGIYTIVTAGTTARFVKLD